MLLINQGYFVIEYVAIKVLRDDYCAADSAWGHEEVIHVSRSSTVPKAIDQIRNTYDWNGVTFKTPKTIWLVTGRRTSQLRVKIALTGLGDSMTDIFDTSLRLSDLDFESPVHFSPCSPTNLQPDPIIQRCYKEGSEIASVFYKLRRAMGYSDEFP